MSVSTAATVVSIPEIPSDVFRRQHQDMSCSWRRTDRRAVVSFHCTLQHLYCALVKDLCEVLQTLKKFSQASSATWQAQ